MHSWLFPVHRDCYHGSHMDTLILCYKYECWSHYFNYIIVVTSTTIWIMSMIIVKMSIYNISYGQLFEIKFLIVEILFNFMLLTILSKNCYHPESCWTINLFWVSVSLLLGILSQHYTSHPSQFQLSLHTHALLLPCEAHLQIKTPMFRIYFFTRSQACAISYTTQPLRH